MRKCRLPQHSSRRAPGLRRCREAVFRLHLTLPRGTRAQRERLALRAPCPAHQFRDLIFGRGGRNRDFGLDRARSLDLRGPCRLSRAVIGRRGLFRPQRLRGLRPSPSSLPRRGRSDAHLLPPEYERSRLRPGRKHAFLADQQHRLVRSRVIRFDQQADRPIIREARVQQCQVLLRELDRVPRGAAE